MGETLFQKRFPHFFLFLHNMEREAADFVLEVYGFGFAALVFREEIRVEFDSHVLKIEYGAVEEVHADCYVS